MSRENGFMIIIEGAKNKATQQLAFSSKKVVIGLIMIVLCVDVANCESLMNLPTTFLLFFRKLIKYSKNFDRQGNVKQNKNSGRILKQTQTSFPMGGKVNLIISYFRGKI